MGAKDGGLAGARPLFYLAIELFEFGLGGGQGLVQASFLEGGVLGRRLDYDLAVAQLSDRPDAEAR